MSKDKKLYVHEELFSEDFYKQYFVKTSDDYSAKDCANIILSGICVPPRQYMSMDSLEKTVLEAFETSDLKKYIYIKRVKGKKNVACICGQHIGKVRTHTLVTSKLEKQEKKAVKKHSDTTEWRTYDYEKAEMEFREWLSSYSDSLSDEEKISSL